jgi:hypothetical protein
MLNPRLDTRLRILALWKIAALRPSPPRASSTPVATLATIVFLAFARPKLLGRPRWAGLLRSGSRFGRRDVRLAGRSFDRFGSAFFGRALARPILSAVTPAVAPAGGPVVFDSIDILAMFFEEIRYVQKGVALEPQVHECGLHSRKHARDASFMDAARQRIFLAALEVNLN